MRRSTLRLFAFVVLALLGAPVAMHVVMHDLHDHHAEDLAATYVGASAHSDHEHPIVASPAPQVPSLTRAVIAIVTAPAAKPAAWSRTASMERNVMRHGALRSDDDVGLQPLLATFLI